MWALLNEKAQEEEMNRVGSLRAELWGDAVSTRTLYLKGSLVPAAFDSFNFNYVWAREFCARLEHKHARVGKPIPIRILRLTYL